MKKLVIGVAVVIVLLVAVLVAAPFLIPVETYKEQIAAQTREATGRELTIAGDFRLSLLPRLELEASDVAFANAPGASEPEMATLKTLLVQLQVWPLLSGEVKVDSFVLVDPVIHLEVDKAGQANWDFGTGEAEAAAQADAEAGRGPGLEQLSLGDVRLVNGLVTYRDARSGDAFEASAINMKIALPDLDSPVAADGSLVWNGKKIELEAASERLRALMAGETVPIEMKVESEPVSVSYQGTVTQAEGGRVAGAVELDVPSIRDLAAWAGNPIDAPGDGLRKLEIDGQVDATAKRVAFTKAAIALDKMNAEGDLAADLSGKVPYLKGRLDIDRVDLNDYLPPEQEQPKQEAAAGAGGAGGEAAPGEWSDEPIDLSGLKAANADFALSVGGIAVQEIKIGRSAVVLSLKDGLLTLDLTELALYNGQGKGRLKVDARGKVPTVEKTFELAGIQAEPFLTDAAGFDRLEGAGVMNIAVAAKGRSQKEMVQALNGKGAVKFTDGAIKGINLAAMVRNVKSAFLDAGAEEAQKTDFAELSGTFTITNGVLRNDDLLLLNPLLRLTGKGTSDIPKRTVNYRITPKAVAALEGQGGQSEAAGIAVPVIIEGPWHDLTYRPDLKGIIEDVARDPTKALEGAKSTVEQLQEGTTGGLGKVLEGVTKSAPAEGEQQQEGGGVPEVGDTLKKLFGN